MLKLHSFLVLVASVLIVAMSSSLLSKGSVNPDVFIKEVKGGVFSAPVTYSPYLDANALGRNLKDNLNHLLSYSISNPKKHIRDVINYFDPSYKRYIYNYLYTAIGTLKLDNVRVVDFIVTQDPVFIGSEVGLESNWTYYVEGYFSYQGIFSNATGLSESVSLFVKVKRGQPTSTNPLGVGIYNIVGLPNF